MQNALNTAELLKQKIEFSPTLDTADKMIIIQKIAKYSSVAGQISDLNSTLRSKLTDFDLQSISIDPISKDLITLANDEVLYAQTQIDQTNQIGTTILVTTVLLGVLLSILVAMALNKSLTKNIVNLTQAASQLQAGNLAVNAPINSEDELGKLAKSFNSMAAQLQSSFTSIQASETRYRSLFEDSPISLWEEDCSVVKEHIEELRARGISDWDSYFDNHPDEGMELAGQVKVVDVNYATLEMFKVSHKEDLLNNITATFGPETMIIFRNELIAMASGMVDFQAETIFRTFDGEDIHVNLKINIVSGYENSWAKILVSMTDISELKRVYNQMRQLNDELEQRVQKRTAQLETANKDLESFAYSVSHDLRAPLRGMDGFSLALLEDYSERLDAQGRDYLKRIRATSQRMSQLIDDLLKLSRVTRSEIQLQKVNLSSMACTIEEELMYTQPQRQVVWQIADHLTATADAGLIHILLDNLMGNAFKFTSKVASARIELSSFDENGETVYWLRDNGAGFDMAYKDKLFGTFQRLHNASEFEGTGIGLALVQRVILRHGGRIWAESTPGKGATFYFTLSNHS